MAGAYRSTGTYVTSTGANITPGLPTGWAADDIFILNFRTGSGGGTHPAITGWTAFGSPTSYSTGSPLFQAHRQYLYWRRATSSESAPTCPTSGDSSNAAQIFAFSGCDTSGDQIDAVAQTGQGTASTSVVAPTATTATANALAVILDQLQLVTATTSAWTNSFTEVYDDTGSQFRLATKTQATPGAIGSTTATASTSTRYNAATFALKPAVTSVTHTATGALTGQIGSVSGSANRFKAHASSGALVGSGAAVTGMAVRQPWTPANDPNLVAWFEASDLATITKDRSNVATAWANKVVSGYNLSASGVQWSATGGPGGRPGMVFDGSTSSFGFVFPLPAANCLIASVRPTATVTAGYKGIMSDAGAMMLAAAGGSSWGTYPSGDSGVTLQGSTDYTLIMDDPATGDFYQNGVDVGDFTSTVGQYPGHVGGTSGQIFNGSVGVAIFTASLSDATRERYEGYIAHKEGRQASLPSGHPYRYSAPYITTVTHTSTGSLVGSGSTVSGAANRFRAHPSTGALVGSGAAVAGSATHRLLHTSTGALLGAGSVVVGVANRKVDLTSTGALVGAGALVAGTAAHNLLHTSNGALVGAGSILAGSAIRFRAHASTGSLLGAGALVAGTSARFRAFTATGALTGAGSSITGSASRTHVFTASGALVGQGTSVAGTANRYKVHASSGALVGSGAVASGVSVRFRFHAAMGNLVGPGARVVGAAARTRAHTSSGALLGQGSLLVGAAARTLTHTSAGILVGGGAAVAGEAVSTSFIIPAGTKSRFYHRFTS